MKKLNRKILLKISDAEFLAYSYAAQKMDMSRCEWIRYTLDRSLVDARPVALAFSPSDWLLWQAGEACGIVR